MIAAIEQVQKDFNDAQTGNVAVSFADLVVLGGAAGIEAAATTAGQQVTVPFTPGRGDAVQARRDRGVRRAARLRRRLPQLRREGRRRCRRSIYCWTRRPSDSSAPEMTVLIGGFRALNGNYKQSPLGVFTKTPGALTNDFFVNLLDISTEWKPRRHRRRHRRRGRPRQRRTAMDGQPWRLAFGWTRNRAPPARSTPPPTAPQLQRRLRAAWDSGELAVRLRR